jgi:hypothetical protein
MIYEAMPDAKAALQLDMLASLLTGHEPIAQPLPRAMQQAGVAPKQAERVPEKTAEVAPLPVLDLVTKAPFEKPVRHNQRPVRTGFIALQEPPPRKQRSSGLLRTLAAVVTLLAVGVWYVGQQHDTPSAGVPDTAGAFSA